MMYINETLLGYVYPTREVRGEKERERERAHRSKWPGLPSPKPLGSIYREGGDGYLHFILLVR
jgi:hypothetical protein